MPVFIFLKERRRAKKGPSKQASAENYENTIVSRLQVFLYSTAPSLGLANLGKVDHSDPLTVVMASFTGLVQGLVLLKEFLPLYLDLASRHIQTSTGITIKVAHVSTSAQLVFSIVYVQLPFASAY